MIVLETERLLFRDHEASDLDAYCAMEADPEVRRYIGGAPRPRDVAERKFQNGLDRPADRRLWMWAAVYKPEGSYIGRCGVSCALWARTGSVVGSEGSLAILPCADLTGDEDLLPKQGVHL